MEPEQRAPHAVLEPTHKQLPVGGALRVPPWNPPMSLVHQGIPDNATLRPART